MENTDEPVFGPIRLQGRVATMMHNGMPSDMIMEEIRRCYSYEDLVETVYRFAFRQESIGRIRITEAQFACFCSIIGKDGRGRKVGSKNKPKY